MNFLSSFFNKNWKGKKIIFGLLIALFILNIFPLFSGIISSVTGDLGFVQETLAEGTETAQSQASKPSSYVDIWKKTDGKNNSTMQKISDWASVIVSVFTPIIAFVVKIVGSLMGDAYIFGDNGAGGFNIIDLLYKLWDVVRTLVNYSFLLILLFFAIMNIIPYATESYELKKVLPSLVLGIVVVNMTFSGMIAIFDVVDVTARVVFSIPQTLLKNDVKLSDTCIINTIPNDKWKDLSGGKSVEEQRSIVDNDPKRKKLYAHGICFPQYITLDPKGNFDAQPREGTAKDIKKAVEQVPSLKGQDIKEVVYYGALTIYWKDFSWDDFDEGTIAPLFAFSVMQIQNLPRIASQSLNTLIDNKGYSEDGGDLGVRAKNMGGAMSLFINIIMSLILMIVVLIVFVLMAINLFFRIVLLWINIIASPLMALKIAFPQALSGAESSVSEYIGFDAFIKFAFAPVIMGLPLVIGFIIIGVGQQYNLLGMKGGIEIEGSIIDGMSSVHALFYYLLAVTILWIGGVKAVESTTAGFVHKFTSKISDGVNGAADMVGAGIMRTPFIPTLDMNGDGKGANASLNNLFSGLPRAFQKANQDRDSAFRKEIGLEGVSDRSYTKRAFDPGGALSTFNNASDKKKISEGLKETKITPRNSNETKKEYIERVFSRNIQNKNMRDALVNLSEKDLAGMIWEAKNKGKSHKSPEATSAITQLVRQMQDPDPASSQKAKKKEDNETENSSQDTSSVQTSQKIKREDKKSEIKKNKEKAITNALKNSDIKPEHLNDNADLTDLDEAAKDTIKDLKTLKITPEEYKTQLEKKNAQKTETETESDAS